MSFVIALGGYYLQGRNGWGQLTCANEYESEAEAKKIADKLGAAVEPKEEEPEWAR